MPKNTILYKLYVVSRNFFFFFDEVKKKTIMRRVRSGQGKITDFEKSDTIPLGGRCKKFNAFTRPILVD